MNISVKRRSRSALVCIVFGLTAIPSAAQADVVFYDKDDWKVFTRGRAEAHYQLIVGDGDPVSSNRLVGGQIQNTGTQDEDNKITQSRIRSGFVGTQLGFGVGNHLMQGLDAEGFIGAWLAGID